MPPANPIGSSNVPVSAAVLRTPNALVANVFTTAPLESVTTRGVPTWSVPT